MLVRNLGLILFLFVSLLSYGAKEVYSVRKAPTYNTFSLDIEDGKFTELGSTNFTDASVNLRVKLGVEERTNFSYIDAYGVLTVQVIFTPINPSGTSEPSITENLTISYSPDGGQGNQINTSVLTHSGYHKYKIEANLVTPNSGPIPLNVYMEAELEVERYYEISAALPELGANSVFYSADGSENITYDVSQGYHIISNNENGRELEVWWDYISGAEEYELEWAWIDNYSDNNLTVGLNASNVDLSLRDFELNNTRIITNDQRYRIPVIYNQGFLVYRVRGVGRWLDEPGKVKFGKWSYNNAGATKVSHWSHYVEIKAGHTNSKNWQHQTVYAEEGKRKDIVSYFDGSLRNRQTVTKINSNNEAIVGESVYDNQGRAAIQILPTPVENPALKYYPQLNRVEDNTANTYDEIPFGHQHFDWDDPANPNTCVSLTQSMSTSSGASKYYSTNNAATGDWQDQVPLADGFPYTQIQYTPDNTGRIRAQSGVGADYTLGSGHETKYFYGQPKQEELNRLFGYQVGNVARYKKNMVVDANGQVSVSYMDPQGRVIATALSGDNTISGNNTVTNLKSLDDELDVNLHLNLAADLLAKLNDTDPDSPTDANIAFISGQNGPQQDGLEVNSNLLSSKDGNPHDFTYGITQNEVFNPCADDENVTYPFDYILEIGLENNCGEPLIPAPTGTEYTLNADGRIIAHLSPNTTAGTFNWLSNLDIGEYQITKKLIVDPVSLHNHALDYIETQTNNPSNNCLSDLVIVNTADCGDDPVPTPANPPGSVIEVNDINHPSGACTTNEIMMLQDLSPNGQYGATSGNMILSVFAETNALDKGFMGDEKTWKFPEGHYKSQDGTDAMIEVYWDGTDATPEIDFTPIASAGYIDVYPEQLQYVEDFLTHWEPSWAGALLPHHPEYGYLEFMDQFCGTSGLSTDEYDATLNQIYTYDQASSTIVGDNFLNTNITLGTTILDHDQIGNISFSSGVTDPGNSGNFIADLLTDLLNNYKGTGVDLWTFCFATVHCGSGTNSACSLPAIGTYDHRDQVWGLFKSIYISEKRKIIQLFADFYAVSTGAYNGYIGENPEGSPAVQSFLYYEPYVTGTTDPLFPNYNVGEVTVLDYMTQALVNRDPLSHPSGVAYATQWSAAGPFNHLFEDKVKRYAPIDDLYNSNLSEADILTQSALETNVQIYQQTGSCPLTIGLEYLLDVLSQPGGQLSLTANGAQSVDANAVPQFTLDMYNSMPGAGGTFDPTMIDIISTYTAGILSIDFIESGTNVQLGNINFNLSGITWNLADIVGMSTIQFTGGQGTNSQTFAILVELNTTSGYEEYVITGTTDITIGDCVLDPDFSVYSNVLCERPNALAGDLYALYKAIFDLEEAQTAIPGTLGNVMGNAYPLGELSSQLLDYQTDLSLTAGLTLVNPAGTTMPTIITLANGDISLSLTTASLVDAANVNLFTGYSISADYSVLTITYLDNNGADHSIDFTLAYDTDPLVPGLNTMDLDCLCEEEVAFSQIFENMVNAAIELETSLPSGLPNGYVFDEFTAIEDYLTVGFNSEGLYDFEFEQGVIYGFNFGFELIPGTCGDVKFTNVITLSAPIAANFVSIENMTIHFNSNGGIESATCEALFDDNTSILLEMVDIPTCVIDLNCDKCLPNPVAPVSCTDEFADYQVLMSQLGIPVADQYTEEEFCESGLAYGYENYKQYLTEQGITNSTHLDSDTYITLSQFAATGLGTGAGLSSPDVTDPMANALQAYNDYLADVNNPFLSWNQYISDVYLPTHNICSPPADIDTYFPIYIPCEQYTANVDIINAQTEYETYIANIIAEFKSNYIEEAMATVVETFDYTYNDKEFHYTLYYYDQAGNLTQTVPPKGVDRLENAVVDHDAINLERESEKDAADPVDVFVTTAGVLPDHDFETQYRYNSLNQLVWQSTPDGGESQFAYDALGRLVLSQNAKQKLNNAASYTVYDDLGRIIEVGELFLDATTYYFNNGLFYNGSNNLVQLSNTPDQPNITFPTNITSGNRKEVTITLYDDLGLSGIVGKFKDYAEFNTRNRITGVLYYDSYGITSGLTDYQSGTFYDYDVHGNVKELIQDIHDSELENLAQNEKTTEYDYDLVSGNVKEVVYQDGEEDQFVHRYCYDADNRITIAETSKDRINWEKDAKYFYYDHGPLARVEMGENKVQSCDYAYTIQGWLKGVNAENLTIAADQGKDGLSGGLNQMNGKDVTGYSLHYFDGDYTGRQGNGFLALSNLATPQPNTDLFNGNIKEMFTASTKTDESFLGTSHTWYTYDQLNRIRSMNQEELGVTEAPAYTQEMYAATYEYDANGNLDKLTRHADNGSNTSVLIDHFTYHYNQGTNQLNYVEDITGLNSVLADNSDLAGQLPNNYDYDAIGQLTQDIKEGIQYINWMVTGKVKSITKTSGEQIEFDYDALGNRISKTVIPTGTAGAITTFYFRDAQGNAMGTYTLKRNDANGTVANQNNLYLSERNIYGSSRLGMEQVNQIIASSNTANITINNESDVASGIYSQQIGDKRYELSNHLGNVLQTISDRKLSIETSPGSNTLAYYSPDVISQSDYYPFGMMLPNRNESSNEYRYGFNSMEKDDEIKGDGNSYTTEFRQYDPRVGRWLSLDPLMAKYPHQSPYAAFNNNPIYFSDPTGLEGDPPGGGEIHYGEVLDKVAGIEVKGKKIEVVDKEINKLKKGIDEAKVDLNLAKIQNSIAKKSKNPIVRGYASSINELLIHALETEIAGAQVTLNKMIENRNNLASQYNSEIYGLLGKLYMAGEISISEDISIPSSEMSGNFLNFLVDDKLAVHFGLGGSSEMTDEAIQAFDITTFRFTSIDAIPKVDVDVPVPSAVPQTSKGGSGRRAAGGKTSIDKPKPDYKPVITNSSGNVVRSQLRLSYTPTLLLPAPPTNSWNAFLKNTKGTYSGEGWIQRASSDYLYLKSKGAQ